MAVSKFPKQHTRRQGANGPAWSAWLVQRAGRRGGPSVSDTVRRGLAWRGLTWPIEVRGLANRSEGLANRSEGLGAKLAQALSIKVRSWVPGRPRPCR